jgi:hypothetical protein
VAKEKKASNPYLGAQVTRSHLDRRLVEPHDSQVDGPVNAVVISEATDPTFQALKTTTPDTYAFLSFDTLNITELATEAIAPRDQPFFCALFWPQADLAWPSFHRHNAANAQACRLAISHLVHSSRYSRSSQGDYATCRS